MAMPSMTAREMEIVTAVFVHMKSDVDWSAIATLANMKTAKYARDKCALIRAKLTQGAAAGAGGDQDGAATDAKKTKSGPKNKRKGSEDADDEEAKPAAKNTKSAPKAKAAAKKTKVTAGTDDEEATPVKAEAEEHGSPFFT